MGQHPNRLGLGVGLANVLLGLAVVAAAWTFGLPVTAALLASVAGLAIAGIGALNAVLAREVAVSRIAAAGNLALGLAVVLVPAAVPMAPAAMATFLTAGVLAAALAGVNLSETPDLHGAPASDLA